MTRHLTLFLCGDVMSGRGVDQILPHPSDPTIHEPYVHDAREYVALAEAASGPIPRSEDPASIWGDAVDELIKARPQARIINLETAVTCGNAYWKGKGINYRMHPQNVQCLTAVRIDVCVLANNHVLDYGRAGLSDTVTLLRRHGLETAGAGEDAASARRPALVDVEGCRVVVFSVGAASSGIPPAWAATTDRPGVDLIDDLSADAAAGIVERIRRVKRAGDIAVVSIHWGGNWGYEVDDAQVAFAHWLVDGGADIVHGHSSHHPRPIEVYNGKLVLYGCGDLINDYEGIGGHEQFRSDLVLMYFPIVDTGTGRLHQLRLSPMHLARMRLNHASTEDAAWLADVISLISAPFHSRATLGADNRLELSWRS
jgi:poly-gamma-glutamate capsule biosynthesis protein CapA/YwtB (metallophosphatase superfamily)